MNDLARLLLTVSMLAVFTLLFVYTASRRDMDVVPEGPSDDEKRPLLNVGVNHNDSPAVKVTKVKEMKRTRKERKMKEKGEETKREGARTGSPCAHVSMDVSIVSITHAPPFSSSSTSSSFFLSFLFKKKSSCSAFFGIDLPATPFTSNSLTTTG